MTLEQWQAIGIVCGAILALAGVLLLAGKGLSMLWDWRFGRDIKASQARIEANQERLEEKLDAHLDWHGQPGGRPAKPVPPRANGGQRTRRL